MKKILTVFAVMTILTGVQAGAAEQATNPVSSFFDKLWQKSEDVNAKIDAQQEKFEKQQKKFEDQRKARDEKILEQQKARKEAYEAQQKRLEQKKQQLKQLLEE